jgi:biotin carboxyl carrier protein
VAELTDSVRSGAVDHLVDNMITAPMPGLVVKVNCTPGDSVEKGQILVIVEAMKMENQMRSPFTGRVKRVTCKGGDRVDANQVLVELETA